MIIQDARNGNTASVDNENRLFVSSVSQEIDKHSNVEGKYDVIFFVVTPTGANDYGFYLKNNGTEDIAVTDIRIISTVPGLVFLDHVTGTPTYTSETAAAVTNRNLGSSSSPTLTANYDVDITGLTKQGELIFQQCAVADTEYESRITSNIIIPQGQAIALRREEATGTLTVLISMSVAET